MLLGAYRVLEHGEMVHLQWLRVSGLRQPVARGYSTPLLPELRPGFRERLEGPAHLSILSIEAGGLG